MSDTPLAPLEITPELTEAAGRSKAWPFEEARKLVERIARRGVPAGGVIFETRHGPPRPPPIGT
ncbi:MAG TPA: lysine--tRNA ligase, partial [Bauldia sp.]|nr:lysine--tRNA ligase [Bauldia sp.]